MNLRRVAWRVAPSLQWMALLLWGIADWQGWGGFPYYWLAYGAAMFLAHHAGKRAMKMDVRSGESPDPVAAEQSPTARC